MIYKKVGLVLCFLFASIGVYADDGFDEDSLYGDEDMGEDMGDYGGDPYGGMGGYGGGGYGGGGYGGYGGMGGYGGGGYGGYGGGGYGGYGGQEAPPLIPVRNIESLEQLQQYLDEDKTLPLIVGYFNEEAENDKAVFDEVYEKVGMFYRFASVTSPEVLKETKYTSAVIVHKAPALINEKYEKAKARFPGKTITSASVLEKFILQKSIPLSGLKTVENTKIFEEMPVAEVTVFAEVDATRNAKQFNYFANRMRKVAVDFVDNALFNVANKNDFEDVLERGYGLELPDRNDVGVGLRDGTNYYKMTTKFSTDNVRAFVESWSRGELAGLEQQQAEMEYDGGEEYSGPSSVVTLTNSNFKDEVTDSNKDIMVEFYAPWCGHCKALKPEYDNASNQLKDVESVMLGAFDASEDSPPDGFDIQGFPTLFFVPGDKSSPIPYEGAREAKSIVKFIQEHATTKFTL